ncbi:RHS repeat-associated core domain-containing protein [Actinacidiphila bryophytorum]|uniref:RHS repeat-associated core domain-containing protein n=1 Tax=Actinacidiphila bryophytorum TaxID=1436133 RepID=UPI002246E0E5|nr:RHS repeat-associated core domain-containing protein [Actinacidiphila bryophytorum]
MSVSLVGYLLAGMLAGPVAEAAGLGLGKLPSPDPVPVKAVRGTAAAHPDQAAAHAWKGSPKVVWPAAGTAQVAVPAAGKAPAKAGGLPVRLGHAAAKKSAGSAVDAAAAGPVSAQVQVLGQDVAKSLGVDGVVLAVKPAAGAAGSVDVQLDYSGFRNAYGGDWASRLSFRQLPACALTSAQGAACAVGRDLDTANDVSAGTLNAPVALAAAESPVPSAPVDAAPASARSATGLSVTGGTVLLAATADAAGSQGSFKATSLSPSASWSAGGSQGEFSWTYGIDTPDVPGGVQPDLSLGYSSQAVDGRTAATNNQANWVGDGWSMDPGYIERQYVSCTDDTSGSNTTAKVGDECWKKDNAVINLNGHSNVLVHDDTTGQWHLEADDGTKAEKLTSSTNNNGDNDGEYWKVTTPDGTAYYFGLNHPTGWASGKAETNSTWTVPVYGNQAGEPCHATAFADSWCQQAWRWNLDAVVDPHGDAMAYYWAKEANSYARNVNPDTGTGTSTSYTRGGYLTRIEYGLRSGDFYATPAAKVAFTVAERCLTDCGTFDKDHAKNWPDTPFDQYCATGATCGYNFSPSFWTRKRLTQIDTSVLVGSTFKPVDTWKLTHQFPATGDGTDPALWLASVSRTGHTGTGDVTLPTVTFMGQTLPNRVEGATTGGDPDPVPPMWRYRVYGINSETGSTLGITYSVQDCKAGDVPTPASNNRRCYPVIWSPPDAPAADYTPYTDWFHSYVVTQVLEQDLSGGAPAKETDYSYLDGMAWGKAEDEFSPAKYLTYGDRKGYGRVQVRTGAGNDARTLKEYRYFRGIEGADVANSDGVKVTDHDAFAGMTREEDTYNGDGGPLLTATSYVPWRSTATATMTRGGLSALSAYATGSGSEITRTAVGSGWRTTRTDSTFDSDGKTLTESKLGDTAVSGDETCETTTYAPNTATNFLTSIAEVKTVAKPCGTTASLPADLVSDEQHYYDDATSLTAAPTKGDVTRLDEQDAAGTGHLTTARHTYDIHGRELTDTDALGNTTTTAYTPATVAAPTSSTSTNALDQTTTTTYDPTRGLTTATVDPNGKRTDAVYDGLGRLLQLWEPGWAKADHPNTPSATHSYLISQSKTQANVVTTRTLKHNGGYATTYDFYDGLLRSRETQAVAEGTQDRLVTETRYDTRGYAAKTYAAYYVAGTPSTTLVQGDDTKVANLTQNVYDGSGRVTAAISLKYGDEQWRTTTVYDGDRTTVIPPKGGTATTTVTDALGRTTELRQYTDAARTAYQKTTYAYGKFDQAVKVTDPAGNAWTYGFDNRGQQTSSDDPDKGLVTTTYDNAGRAVTTTDARGITLTTDYDKLGRRTALKQGSTVLADWTYDTVAKGQLTASTRYVGGAAYTEATGGFDDRYQPTSSSVTIPSAAGGLAGTYTWTTSYDPATGLQDWSRTPAVGDVPAELITTDYNSDDLPFRTTRAGVALVSNTTYDAWSRPVRLEFGGTVGKKVYEERTYDEFSGRLTEQTTDRDLAPQRIDDTHYAYDDAGNITGVTTASGQDAGLTTDAQCFSNDALGQLTQAWTTTTNCASAPTTSTVGGPDAYWQSFSYDLAGNRTQQTDHATATGSTDAVTTYTQPTPNTGLPHAVQQTTTTGGTAPGSSSFAYDADGNTKTRTINGGTQSLTWDAEGHLATLAAASGTTSYLYDADGNRLITTNPDGSSILTLPDDSEVHLAADHTTKTGVRYYDHAGETVAVNDGNALSYLFGDQQGTATAAVAALTLAVSRRKQLPFGQTRGTSGAFPGDQGFVGGTTDPTGLIHLGAREYDPVLGRFLSVDPVNDITDPAQMNAYSYAHNNPVTKSDPDGTRPLGPTDGGTTTDNAWANDRGMSAGWHYKNGRWVWGQTPKKDKASRKKYAHYRANPTHYMIDDKYAKARAKQIAKEVAAIKAQAKKRREQEAIDQALAMMHKEDPVGDFVSGAAKSGAKWVKDHPQEMVHFGINVGAGFAAGLIAAGVCAGTAGVACAVYAGVGIGLLIGMPSHLIADRIMGHVTTAGDAVNYFIGSAWRGGFQGAFRKHFGVGPATKAIKSVKKLKFW